MTEGDYYLVQNGDTRVGGNGVYGDRYKRVANRRPYECEDVSSP